MLEESQNLTSAIVLTKVRKMYIRKKTASSTNGAGKNWITTCRRLKLDPYLSLCTKIYLKWIKGLNIRPKAFKLLQENTTRYRYR
jgi:hypothetical protein